MIMKILPPVSDYDLKICKRGEMFLWLLLQLDALISNQDRHHENWAIMLNNETGRER